MAAKTCALTCALLAAGARGATILTESIITSGTGVPSITLSTAVATATAPLNSALPSQAALPPTQAWCPSQIFCAGELLQSLNLAGLYADPKTYVDKPTSKSSQSVLSDFSSIQSSNLTEGGLLGFVDSDFKGEGLELQAVEIVPFNTSPAFLGNVSNGLVKAFAQTVHGFWTQLIRDTNSSALCSSGECESSLIPLNHTFVVPGGRFREQYYWDSYWIVQGLLESQLYDIANATLQNFMDELERFGFIPNGGRIYYLNRSQPPVFINMLMNYVSATNDTSILARALPLAETELSWWGTNRTVNVTSPFSGKTYAMARYAVNNTAPRPESYLQDYTTANVPAGLDDQAKADLYAELASGAETGWDYSSRFMKDPIVGLRSLNVRGTIPVDLNSILYAARTNLAKLYAFAGRASDGQAQTAAAETLREGILDLHWDADKLAFYDFNTSANARNEVFTAAHFYPLWSGIVPPSVLNGSQSAFGLFAAVNLVMTRYNGTFPVSFSVSGQQWDAPNAWPPHQYIILEALNNLPANVTTESLPSAEKGKSTYSLIPKGQMNVGEGDLPPQLIAGAGNATTTGSKADVSLMEGTVFNGGNATDGENWAQVLKRELANRYVASALCSWHATGGSIDGMLPRLSDQELNVTQSQNNTGNMFEKFSNSDIDSAGRGGEYTVQAGFGWTNGVLLWVAAHYGDVLVAPTCPDLLVEVSTPSGDTKKSGAAAVRVSGLMGAVVATLAVAGVVAL